MLGYTEKEIRFMQSAISMFVNTKDKDIQTGLLMAIDFFDGLMEEGRI